MLGCETELTTGHIRNLKNLVRQVRVTTGDFFDTALQGVSRYSLLLSERGLVDHSEVGLIDNFLH